ncbi:hypothetical protein F4782DRAFT_549986 [Xylaria castorea]|nr:hypothetical protein F4782DRAFT_549986 [Xylaria castorea]
MAPQTPYQILGVSKNDDMATIKRAWHALCLSSHPDKVGQTAESHENFIRIQDAYESICKKQNGHRILKDETHKDRPAGERPWYETGSENNYQAKGKGDPKYTSHSEATEDINELDWDLQLLLSRVGTFFIRYGMVCPRSEKSTWEELERCSQSLSAAAKEATTLASRIFDMPRQSWKQDNDETRAILATLSRLRVKCDRMIDVQRQLESTARVVEKQPIGSRQGPKRLLRTQATRWP